jgi:HAD superfamily hydrolase (TIGR01509 family)
MNNIFSNYDVFVFDLDDTLIKTEQYHYEAWLETIRTFLNNEFKLSFKEFTSIFHSIKQDSIKNYLINELKIENYEDGIKTKNQLYYNLINKNKEKLKMVDGADEFIQEILKNNKKFVIVTNSPKEQLDFFSDIFSILKNSTKNYYREMFKNKKPNPECYLKVVNDFPNQRLIGFEDSITGIHSITQTDIFTYYISNPNYYYNNYILDNYKVNPIKNYNIFK